MEKKIAIVLIIAMIVVFVFSITNLAKQDIHEATIEELSELEDIGEILAGKIVVYVAQNSRCSIDELSCINGIGEKRLEEIKRYYK